MLEDIFYFFIQSTWQKSGQKSKDRLNDDRSDEGRFPAETVRSLAKDIRTQEHSDHKEGLEHTFLHD